MSSLDTIVCPKCDEFVSLNPDGSCPNCIVLVHQEGTKGGVGNETIPVKSKASKSWSALDVFIFIVLIIAGFIMISYNFRVIHIVAADAALGAIMVGIRGLLGKLPFSKGVFISGDLSRILGFIMIILGVVLLCLTYVHYHQGDEYMMELFGF